MAVPGYSPQDAMGWLLVIQMLTFFTASLSSWSRGTASTAMMSVTESACVNANPPLTKYCNTEERESEREKTGRSGSLSELRSHLTKK